MGHRRFICDSSWRWSQRKQGGFHGSGKNPFDACDILCAMKLNSYLRQVEAILRNYPRLKTQLHANGTNIEGEWEDVMSAVKTCHERLHAAGVPCP